VPYRQTDINLFVPPVKLSFVVVLIRIPTERSVLVTSPGVPNACTVLDAIVDVLSGTRTMLFLKDCVRMRRDTGVIGFLIG